MTLLLTWFIFVLVLGACVGSFLNVVIYRLPAGESIVSPPSSCPRCGHRLAWYDNVPVLGWLWLRGRCRYCARPISIQYPLVEATTAVLFGGWFAVCYFSGLRPGYAGPGLEPTWIIFTVDLVLLAVLLASSMIDAKYYIIPLELPWLATAAAVALLPLAVWLVPDAVREVAVPFEITKEARFDAVPPPYDAAAAVRVAVDYGLPGPVIISPAPTVAGRTIPMSIGAALGLALALALLWRGVLPRSFDDPEHEQPKESDPPPVEARDYQHEHDDENEGEAVGGPHDWPVHPHPRREVLKECLFLSLPILGAVVGYFLWEPSGAALPLRVFAGVLLGYLVGGAIVWGTRILGTLGFGKEAMGLGDVHLMAAVGAVCGWRVAVLAFFIAPFFGLAWALGSAGAAKLLHRRVKMIPYGPHLALASVLVMIVHEPLLAYMGIFMGV